MYCSGSLCNDLGGGGVGWSYKDDCFSCCNKYSPLSPKSHSSGFLRTPAVVTYPFPHSVGCIILALTVVFELTGSLTYVMPIMLSILISKWVSEAISQQGIYDLVISLNQHPYLDSKKRFIFTSTFADLCTPQSEDSRNCIDVTNGGKDIAAGGLREKVDWLKEVGGRDGGFCIVKEGVLLGYISASELEYALGMISSPFQLFKDECHL
jgi:hypothetical protein